MNGPLVMAAVFIFTMAIGVPIPFAAGLATVAGILLADIPLTLMAQSAWTAFEPFPLVTIPLFVLAGQLMEHGGMSEKLVAIAHRLVGVRPGHNGCNRFDHDSGHDRRKLQAEVRRCDSRGGRCARQHDPPEQPADHLRTCIG